MLEVLINKTILLVDDSETDAFLLRHEFNRCGLRNQIIWVSTGEKALEYLKGVGQYGDREQSPFPSILMLDLKLPGTNGFEVLEWIRRQPELKKLLIIVLSGMEDTKSADLAYQLGANSYLNKPVKRGEIAKLAEFFKEYWLIADPAGQNEHIEAFAAFRDTA